MTPDFLKRRIDQCRRLVAMRILPKEAFPLFDSLAYGQGRTADADAVICTYDELTGALAIGRAKVAECLRRLIGVGLIGRRHRFELVEWRQGKRWVQLANEYRFVPDNYCEFPTAPPKVSKKRLRQSLEAAYGQAATDPTLAQRALAAARALMLQRQAERVLKSRQHQGRFAAIET